MAQVLLNLSIHRGDTETFRVKIPDDHTNRKVYFTAKKTRSLTDARQIDLSNQEVNQLELSYDAQANETEVVIPLLPEHTSDLTVTTLEIDIQSVNSLSSDIVTPASGQLHVNFDVRTEFDNYDLPTEPVTFQQVDASDFKVDSLIWVQEVNGIRTMKEITIAELKTELGI